LPCTDQRAAIWVYAWGDPVCSDLAGSNRVAVNASIAAKVAGLFRL
jgi:hypothetical protein